jgi:TonB family protein
MSLAMSRPSERFLVLALARALVLRPRLRSAAGLLAAVALLGAASAQQPVAADSSTNTAAQPAQDPQPAAQQPEQSPSQPTTPPSQDTQPAPQQPAQPSAQPATPTSDQPSAAAPSTTTEPAVPAQEQQPTTTVPTETQPATQSAAPPPATEDRSSATNEGGGITEDQLKQLLVGKPLYLRGGYLDDSLSFNEHGALTGHSAQGSYTLCGVQIDKVKLTKHKVELVGARYGLHFLGALAYEDPTTAVDRVRVTPKKKTLKITIDREIVIKPKKVKQKKEAAAKPAPAAGNAPAQSSTETAQPSTASDQDAAPTSADEAKTEMAAAPPEERPADPNSVTTTTSPAHAAKVLKEALDAIFSQGLDERMMASMPDFWKLYYQAAAAKTDYRPKDPAVLRQSAVDTKAKLLTTFEPESNEFAQANGVAGMSLYHVVIGSDGKPGEVAVARPIGFGLDENAVAAIRNAKFEPAVKGGQPVPVLLDLVVQFRIYSKRTAATGSPEEAAKPAGTVLPGPYSVQHPPQQQPPTQQ